MGWQEIIAGLGQIADADAHVPALMDGLCEDMVEDNRVGVLKGLDKDNVPMKAVARGGAADPNAKARKGAKYGVPVLKHYLGPELIIDNILVAKGAKANGNLTKAEYAKLTGPPLAPRKARSRSIANLIGARFRQISTGVWVATVYWVDVVSKKGVPFLKGHFEGENGLPVRDLRGVRPPGIAAAKKRVDDWAKGIMGIK